MTSSDVRSILNLPQTGSTAPLQRRPVNVARRPEGISRELYALIGDNAPSLAEVQASLITVKYRDRPKVKGRRIRWELTPFTPARHNSRPVLSHWIQVIDNVTADADETAAYFARFNEHGPSVMEYSQYEYDQHLADADWTSHETSYLFDQLRIFDLRFVVTADRYDYTGPRGEGPLTRRSVEDIKDRYYTICRRLVRTRTASDPQGQQQLLQAYSFDKVRETKRKHYASELFHLTTGEIAEEESIFVEIKRMEQNERRYRSDRDDLLRRVMGLDSGLFNLEQANSEGVLGLDKNKKRRRPDEGELDTSPVGPLTKKQKDSATFDLAKYIYRVPSAPSNPSTSHLAAKHPVHQPVFLRTSKIPLPKVNAAIRITDLLSQMGISTQKLVMPTRENLEILERVFQAASGLVDMKRQVDRVEQELRTLRAQKDGFVPSVRSGQARSESVTSTDTSTLGRRSRRS